MSVSRIDGNQTNINALSQASPPAMVAKDRTTAPKGNEGSTTDSVTISKQAQAAASQLHTRASETMETPVQEATETLGQKATEMALGLDLRQ